VWLAYDEAEAVGCVLLRGLPKIPNAGEVKRLYVREPERGRGLAAALMSTLEAFAGTRGLRWLYLDTTDELRDAIRFYERHGYERCERYNDNPQATIFMKRELKQEVEFRSYAAGDAKVFRELNEAWITKYFELEKADGDVLADPDGYIIAPGGYIVMAMKDGEAVGCCALLKMSDEVFEVAKMTVVEELRGLGVGREMLGHVIAVARERGATRLYLGTNTELRDAIHLYESVGFRHISAEHLDSPYKRANVHMEMVL
jgi:GNAT superfamily N-acetyltransferase